MIDPESYDVQNHTNDVVCSVVPGSATKLSVAFKEISYKVKQLQILDSVSAVVPPGSLLGILGPSGSGRLFPFSG